MIDEQSSASEQDYASDRQPSGLATILIVHVPLIVMDMLYFYHAPYRGGSMAVLPPTGRYGLVLFSFFTGRRKSEVRAKNAH